MGGHTGRRIQKMHAGNAAGGAAVLAHSAAAYDANGSQGRCHGWAAKRHKQPSWVIHCSCTQWWLFPHTVSCSNSRQPGQRLEFKRSRREAYLGMGRPLYTPHRCVSGMKEREHRRQREREKAKVAKGLMRNHPTHQTHRQNCIGLPACSPLQSMLSGLLNTPASHTESPSACCVHCSGVKPCSLPRQRNEL